MPYCTAADVRLLVDTDLTDDEIVSLIESSDALIDKTIGTQSASDKLIKRLSMLLTAKEIKTRQPQSYVVGEDAASTRNVLEIWEEEIKKIFRLYKSAPVKSTEYRHIDEKKRYSEV